MLAMPHGRLGRAWATKGRGLVQGSRPISRAKQQNDAYAFEQFNG